MSNKTQNQIAFSLVELMLVVAILAILACIATPYFRNYIKTSQKSTFLAEKSINTKLFCLSIMSYYVDNDKYAPSSGTYKIVWNSSGAKIQDTITTWLKDYKPPKFIDLTLVVDNPDNFTATFAPTSDGPYTNLSSVVVDPTTCEEW